MKYNFVKLLLGGGVTDTNNSNFDQAAVNRSYLEVNKNLFGRKDFNMDDFNNFLARYYALKRGSGYSGNKAIKYSGTSQYLTDYHNYGYHTPEFMRGWQHTNKPLLDSGDNFDLGKWNKADDYFGAITNKRVANLFNLNELTEQNNAIKLFGLQWIPDERAEGIETDGERKFYKLARIPSSSSTLNLPETTSTTTPDNNTTTENKSLGNEAVTFAAQLPARRLKLPWTDWLPLSLMEANDLMAIERNAALRKKLRFPLEEAPFFQHKVTNNYNLRTGMLQKANELRDLAAFRSNSSDLNQNMENIHKYDTSASEIELLAELEKAKKFAEETKIAENVANTNTETGVKVANNNMKQNAAAWNNILEANMERNLRRNQSINSYIGNMYTSHGEWLKDMRINDSEYLKGLNQMKANQKIQEYNDQLNKLYNDYKNSNAYQQFVNEFTAGGDGSTFDSDTFSKDPEGYLKNSWYGDSEIAKRYRALYEQEKADAYNEFIKNYQLVNNQLAAANLMIPSRVNNQGVYYNIFANGTYNPNISPLYLKSGGRLSSRFIDYQEHVNRELRDVRRGQHKRNELSTKKLDADLGRLSKEQLILLRQIFK